MNRTPVQESGTGIINRQRPLRAIEAHSGLSARIASDAAATLNGATASFDLLWASSFTSSAAKFLPDAELYLLDRRLDTICEILAACRTPVVVDADTGGEPLAFSFLAERLERLGVAAVCIEDKAAPKRNSFSEEPILLEAPDLFAAKIRAGIAARSSTSFQIIARVESLVAGESVSEAIDRALIYGEAGADAILIQCKDDVRQLFAFAERYRALGSRKQAGEHARLPLVCVPTSFPNVQEGEFFAAGFDVVIYANHLLRAAFLAMERVCHSILKEGSASSCAADLVDMKRLLRYPEERREESCSAEEGAGTVVG
jgi:phosphoenolpyruvate phosphomutase